MLGDALGHLIAAGLLSKIFVALMELPASSILSYTSPMGGKMKLWLHRHCHLEESVDRECYSTCLTAHLNFWTHSFASIFIDLFSHCYILRDCGFPRPFKILPHAMMHKWRRQRDMSIKWTSEQCEYGGRRIENLLSTSSSPFNLIPEPGQEVSTFPGDLVFQQNTKALSTPKNGILLQCATGRCFEA